MNSVHSVAQLGNEMERQVTGSLVGKHVSWINKPRTGLKKFGVTLLAFIETIALTVSLVGIYAIYKANAASTALKKSEALKRSQITANPPSDDPIIMKSKTKTFNHVNFYAINDGMIWFKPKNPPDSKWQPFYFDGYLQGRIPIEIQADGANLAILDDQNTIHYKKILVEKRKGNHYDYKDITTQDNWTDRWFTFPIVEKFYHMFRRKELSLPKDSLGWAMSHRGEYNHYFIDASGKMHPKFAMVTTIYSISKDGKNINFADPFLMNELNHTIEGPHPNFVIRMIAASASMVIILGELDGKTEMYYRLTDFDVDGHNPFLEGFWSKKHRSNQNWIKIQLPEDSIKGISISQTGEGNDARTIHLEGSKQIYAKNLSEDSWQIL